MNLLTDPGDKGLCTILDLVVSMKKLNMVFNDLFSVEMPVKLALWASIGNAVYLD